MKGDKYIVVKNIFSKREPEKIIFSGGDNVYQINENENDQYIIASRYLRGHKNIRIEKKDIILESDINCIRNTYIGECEIPGYVEDAIEKIFLTSLQIKVFFENIEEEDIEIPESILNGLNIKWRSKERMKILLHICKRITNGEYSLRGASQYSGWSTNTVALWLHKLRYLNSVLGRPDFTCLCGRLIVQHKGPCSYRFSKMKNEDQEKALKNLQNFRNHVKLNKINLRRDKFTYKP